MLLYLDRHVWVVSEVCVVSVLRPVRIVRVRRRFLYLHILPLRLGHAIIGPFVLYIFDVVLENPRLVAIADLIYVLSGIFVDSSGDNANWRTGDLVGL